MLKNLNSILQTTILAGVVLIAGWWTYFLRGKLGEHERQLEEREERITLIQSRLAEREDDVQRLTVSVEEGQVEIQRLGTEVSERDERIAELDRAVAVRNATIARQKAELRELEAALKLLKVDHRLARLRVVEQVEDEDSQDGYRTRVEFSELGPGGTPLAPPREFEIDGRVVYVETLVIKFGDDYVERGDALRGSSICLFRRLFGAHQRPAEGHPLDSSGTQPAAYAEDEGPPDDYYQELWSRFWDYANDPSLARSKGVRALHGEAPFIELRPGKSYSIELRSSGGLSIQAE